MSTRFVEPKNKKVLVEQKPESLRRKELACKKISHSYIPNRTIDKAQIETSLYAQKYPANVRKRLTTISRVKIKPDQFEINENLDIQTDGKVTECLVFGVAVYVDYPDDPVGTNVLASCREIHGVYARPWAQIQRDDLGNIISSEVKYWKNMFYIEFDRENVNKVLQEYGEEYRDLALAYGHESGNWYGDRVFHCSNIEEWLTEPFEDIISANKGNYLRPEAGGVSLFQKDRQEKRKQMEAQVREFKKVK